MRPPRQLCRVLARPARERLQRVLQIVENQKMRSNLLALTAILVSGANVLAAEPPLAWITFEEQAVQEYDNVPYLWLGEQPIDLIIDVPPADGHVIDLLWRSKDD